MTPVPERTSTMNLRNRFATVLTAAILAGSLAGAAQAQNTDTASVQITAGTFTASINADNFSNATYSFIDQTVTSNGLVLTITNLSGSTEGWQVTTTATNYIGTTRTGETIPFSNTRSSGDSILTSEAGQATTGVTPSISLGQGGATSPILSVTAEAGAGRGEYDLTLSELSLNIPGGTLAQTYMSTLTVNIPTAP